MHAPDSVAAASGARLVLGSWKSPSTELRGKSAQPATSTAEIQGEVYRLQQQLGFCGFSILPAIEKEEQKRKRTSFCK